MISRTAILHLNFNARFAQRRVYGPLLLAINAAGEMLRGFILAGLPE